MIELITRGIEKKFETKEVLKGAGFTFQEGRIYGLLGRNGAGKTTFFNCISGDLPADKGEILVCSEGGAEPHPVTAADVGMVQSTPNVPEFLTGGEFLRFFLEIQRDKIKNPLPVQDYFRMVQIEPEDQRRLLKDYSHGMKSKMQMLINLIANPPVLLLDEPLTSLDVVAQEDMKQLLRSMKDGHVLILSTHIMDLALDLCDDIVILQDGVLEEIPRESLDDEAYKDRIIAILKGKEEALP